MLARGGIRLFASGVFLLASTSCGRIGYDVDPSDAGSVDAIVDATGDTVGGPDLGVVDSGCPSGTPTDACSSVPALAVTPAIDGVLECGLALHDWTPVAWSGSGPIPSGLSAQYAIAWTRDGLYFFIVVHGAANRTIVVDPMTVYCGDSIELYVDDDGRFSAFGRYDSPGTVQLVAAAPPIGPGSEHAGGRFRNEAFVALWSSNDFRTFATSDGYVFEAIVHAADLDLASWSPTAGGRVGLDLAVNVSGRSTSTTCPMRLGQFFLHVTVAPDSCNGLPFCDTRAFCTPTLQ